MNPILSPGFAVPKWNLDTAIKQRMIIIMILVIKSTSVKKGCVKSKKTPKFGAGAIFKNCKEILKAQKLLVHWATVDHKDKSMLKS